jgi:spore maturation protein CgeB
VFWDDANECAAHCKRLLADPTWASEIRQAGQRRLLANQVGNEDICRAVFKRLNVA